MRIFMIGVYAVALSLFATLPGYARQGDDRLDPLFDRLVATENPVEARVLEEAIWQIWLDAASPTVELLTNHGMKAIQDEDYAKALELFDDVVTIDPNYAEGWNKRATVFYLLGQHDAALRDIDRALALEPRHFGALAGMAAIKKEQNDLAGALKALTRAVAANPHIPAAKQQLRELERKVRGDAI